MIHLGTLFDDTLLITGFGGSSVLAPTANRQLPTAAASDASNVALNVASNVDDGSPWPRSVSESPLDEGFGLILRGSNFFRGDRDAASVDY